MLVRVVLCAWLSMFHWMNKELLKWCSKMYVDETIESGEEKVRELNHDMSWLRLLLSLSIGKLC